MSRLARVSSGFASTGVRRVAKIHQPQAGAVALGKGVEERIEELEARLAEQGVGDAQPKWLRCVRAAGRDSLHSRSPPGGISPILLMLDDFMGSVMWLLLIGIPLYEAWKVNQGNGARLVEGPFRAVGQLLQCQQNVTASSI